MVTRKTTKAPPVVRAHIELNPPNSQAQKRQSLDSSQRHRGHQTSYRDFFACFIVTVYIIALYHAHTLLWTRYVDELTERRSRTSEKQRERTSTRCFLDVLRRSTLWESTDVGLCLSVIYRTEQETDRAVRLWRISSSTIAVDKMPGLTRDSLIQGAAVTPCMYFHVMSYPRDSDAPR